MPAFVAPSCFVCEPGNAPSPLMNQLHHRENPNRDRASLFASANPSSSGRSSPLPTHYPKHLSGYAANRTAEDLEGQNEEHLEGLSAKVRMLKDVSEDVDEAGELQLMRRTRSRSISGTRCGIRPRCSQEW